MSTFYYEEEGYFYPTTAGKISLVILAVVLLLIFTLIRGKKAEEEGSHTNVKRLVCSALLIALAFVTSYIRFFDLPYGGSITLMSMFFITYIGYCFGLKAGLSSAFAFSVLQFLQEPYVLTPFQVCCDYFFAFTALGLSGLFKNRKWGLYTGYIVGAIARGLFHVLGGYLYWMDFMPENFPVSLKFIYPFVYNFSFIGVEMILTICILLIPGVRKVLTTLKNQANS